MWSDYPQGDSWKLTDNDPDSLNYGMNYYFDFSFIASDDIKKVVKLYAWINYRTMNLRLSTVCGYVNSMEYFNDFAEKRGIKRLLDLTSDDISMYVSYLRTKLSRVKGCPLSHSSQRHMVKGIKSIFYWCQIHAPDVVPKIEIFTGNECQDSQHRLKIDFIPDDVVLQINRALKGEENPCLKYFIIIVQLTGIRMGDLLNLRTDCIKPHLISGHTITWFDHKSRKQRKMPVSNECAVAVEAIIRATEKIRIKAEDKVKDYLFIHLQRHRMKGTVTTISQTTVKYWFRSFAARNKILGSDNELYNLGVHKFRRTLATDMFSKGMNIKIIQEILGHTSVRTTKRHYADVRDKERAATFQNIGIIGNIRQIDASIISEPAELEWFKENMDTTAAMCDGFCTKPFISGKICDRLLKRQKCYTCSRYITTPEYLEVHKNHLGALEKQLVENIYGEHYAEHFIPTIEILKEIITRLEGVQNETD
ncbi:MAG: site-specific integrase [Clostridiales bacterium]|jgi:integrase|nr:site-specific integrase [Clostridiales bacterium]